MPWVPVPSLSEEAQVVYLQLFQRPPDGQCRDYAVYIVEMAEVLHHTRANTQSQQSPNAYWVMLKCLTLLSNLLAVFEKSIESSQGWTAVAFPTMSRADAVRLETTRICLLLWLLLLRMVIWGRSESSEFMPPFESSLLTRYKCTALGQEIYVALSSWNGVLRPSTKAQKKLEEPIRPPTAAKLTLDMAAIITKLEDTAHFRLGKFMNLFLHLEYHDGSNRTTVNSLALITSSTAPASDL